SAQFSLARSIRKLLVGGDGVVDQFRQAHTALDRVVVDKMELRYRVQVEAMREFAAEEARRARERRNRLRRVLLAGKMREMHGRVRKIRRYVDLRQGHAPHARILDAVDQQIGKLALDLIRDALCALRVFFHRYSVRDTSTIS